MDKTAEELIDAFEEARVRYEEYASRVEGLKSLPDQIIHVMGDGSQVQVKVAVSGNTWNKTFTISYARFNKMLQAEIEEAETILEVRRRALMEFWPG